MPAELALAAAVSDPTPLPDSTEATARRERPALTIFRHPAVAFLALLAVTFVVYAPALGGDFLWDDNFLVKGNGLIRSPIFCLEVFRHTLFNGDSNFYRPTQSLTYLFDYWCWGLEPFGYHLTNTLVQACNGFLLFALLRRVLPVLVPPATANASRGVRRPGTDRAAFAIALIWVLHPVHSAAVAYISGRADSLAMAFCLAAWLLCERAFASARSVVRWSCGTGAFLCLVLGLCSKEIAFVWLVLFIGWSFALRPDDRLMRRRRLIALAGGGVALVLYLFLRHLPAPPPPPPAAPAAAMPARGILMLRALGDYTRLMFFPDRLFMERQVFAAPGLADPETPLFYNGLALLGAGMFAAFALGASLPGRGRLLRRCGAAWFLVGFLPISNLFSLNASVAEHWLYLPGIGFLLFVAGVLLDLPWPRLPAAIRSPGAAVGIVLVVAGALGVRTWLRAHDWTDRMTFYRQTIRDGGDVPRAREGLALSYLDAGGKAAEQAAETKDPTLHAALSSTVNDDYTAAVALLDRIVTRYPHAFSARVNLATALLRLGRTDEARAHFEDIASDLLATTDRRGGPREFIVTLRSLDRLVPPADPAWAERRRALLDQMDSRFPEAWEVIQVRIADDENAHDLTGALALANHFADEHWWHEPARVAVGRLFAAQGRTEEAVTAWEQAARLDVHDADALADASALCVRSGRLSQALSIQERAVRRRPDSLRQHLLLAQVLTRLGRTAEAAGERDAAARLAESDNG